MAGAIQAAATSANTSESLQVVAKLQTPPSDPDRAPYTLVLPYYLVVSSGTTDWGLVLNILEGGW